MCIIEPPHKRILKDAIKIRLHGSMQRAAYAVCQRDLKLKRETVKYTRIVKKN